MGSIRTEEKHGLFFCDHKMSYPTWVCIFWKKFYDKPLDPNMKFKFKKNIFVGSGWEVSDQKKNVAFFVTTKELFSYVHTTVAHPLRINHSFKSKALANIWLLYVKLTYEKTFHFLNTEIKVIVLLGYAVTCWKGISNNWVTNVSEGSSRTIATKIQDISSRFNAYHCHENTRYFR